MCVRTVMDIVSLVVRGAAMDHVMVVVADAAEAVTVHVKADVLTNVREHARPDVMAAQETVEDALVGVTGRVVRQAADPKVLADQLVVAVAHHAIKVVQQRVPRIAEMGVGRHVKLDARLDVVVLAHTVAVFLAVDNV